VLGASRAVTRRSREYVLVTAHMDRIGICPTAA
jgi:hypothetical protein